MDFPMFLLFNCFMKIIQLIYLTFGVWREGSAFLRVTSCLGRRALSWLKQDLDVNSLWQRRNLNVGHQPPEGALQLLICADKRYSTFPVFKKEMADAVKPDLLGMLWEQLLQTCPSNEISREMSGWWTAVVFWDQRRHQVVSALKLQVHLSADRDQTFMCIGNVNANNWSVSGVLGGSRGGVLSAEQSGA